MGRVRGAGMGQRMLEEPGRGGTEKEGFGCSAELHNQPGGLGGCSEGPALEKKVTKSALGGTSPLVVHFPSLHGQDESTECRKIPAPKPQVRDAGPFQQCPPSIPGCQRVPVPGEPQGSPQGTGSPGNVGPGHSLLQEGAAASSPNLPNFLQPLAPLPGCQPAPGHHVRPHWDLVEPPTGMQLME